LLFQHLDVSVFVRPRKTKGVTSNVPFRVDFVLRLLPLTEYTDSVVGFASSAGA
jgi:hypothetical protein